MLWDTNTISSTPLRQKVSFSNMHSKNSESAGSSTTAIFFYLNDGISIATLGNLNSCGVVLLNFSYFLLTDMLLRATLRKEMF
jgi:hypothetical protein